MIRGRIGFVVVTLGVVALAVVILAGVRAPVGAAAGAQDVTERALLDNARVTVVEYVFPAGFRGEEHAAIADEFAYVLDGEFAVVTKGVGKRVVRRGEIEYASKGTIHYSLNEAKRPARVLVVLLKER
jgi:quercetin dioxygenase-like cupin family protein